ncbi:hypothetical protein SUGI_0507930 [Cryptomeria japonica]|nr:hypothetical protein SUGI_0507930 [Cryptomeria japonica]
MTSWFGSTSLMQDTSSVPFHQLLVLGKIRSEHILKSSDDVIFQRGCILQQAIFDGQLKYLMGRLLVIN